MASAAGKGKLSNAQRMAAELDQQNEKSASYDTYLNEQFQLLSNIMFHKIFKKNRPKNVKSFNYNDLICGLGANKFKKIAVLTGFEINQNAGIPDYYL